MALGKTNFINSVNSVSFLGCEVCNFALKTVCIFAVCNYFDALLFGHGPGTTPGTDGLMNQTGEIYDEDASSPGVTPQWTV
jgi:hypothetical protein